MRRRSPNSGKPIVSVDDPLATDGSDETAHRIDGTETLDRMGEEIFTRILAVASGEKSKSEALGVGEDEFIPWPIGVLG